MRLSAGAAGDAWTGHPTDGGDRLCARLSHVSHTALFLSQSGERFGLSLREVSSVSLGKVYLRCHHDRKPAVQIPLPVRRCELRAGEDDLAIHELRLHDHVNDDTLPGGTHYCKSLSIDMIMVNPLLPHRL